MSIYRVFESQPVSSIALEPVVSVQSSAPLAETLKVMRGQGAAFALVFGGEDLVGIFTERDLLMRVIGPEGLPEGPIAEFMTPNPTCLDAARPVSQALKPMVEGSYRHLPARAADGSYLGVLSIHSLFAFLAELMPDQILNLPPRPHQAIAAAEGA